MYKKQETLNLSLNKYKDKNQKSETKHKLPKNALKPKWLKDYIGSV